MTEPLIRIVDDDAAVLEGLAFILEGEGWKVRTYDSAEKFLREDAPSVPGCLILDINMPGVNGMQFAEALSKLKNPPAVVFVTAYSEYGADAFGVNAIDYLVKPVETDRLRQAVDKVRVQCGQATKKPAVERIPVEKGGKKVLVPIDKIR